MAMTKYSGWEYLLIDAASQYGLDKETFEARIKWAQDNLVHLESLAHKAETQPLFIKAVMAIRKAQRGEASGHLVGLDASCSGIQVMSVLTGCIAGASATGLVDPKVRADAYGLVKKEMNRLLEDSGVQTDISRKQAKIGTMTAFYGSKRQPKIIFGDGTPELQAFYEAITTIAPGAWDLLQTLLNSWQSHVLAHEWTLPDGFEAKVKVIETIEDFAVEIEELDRASFSYNFKVNMPLPKGHKNTVSLPANVTHSCDAYLLRCIHRRCNYDREVAEAVYHQLLEEKAWREIKGIQDPDLAPIEDKRLARYVRLWQATQMADVVILPHVLREGAEGLPGALLERLVGILEGMLQYRPFPVVTVHDEFRTHANHMNHLRQQYVNVLAEMAESTMLNAILSEIHGKACTYHKLSKNLGQLIRGSAYALC